MKERNTRHVVVIGGGIVGVAVCRALLADGHRVTLVEPEAPGGAQAASFGNAAFLSPASIVPMSMPGLWRQVPGYLADRRGALTVRWRHLPRLLPWLAKFLAAGRSRAKVERTAAALAGLLRGAPDRHAAIAAGIGAPEFIRRTGLLYLYADREAHGRDGLGWELRRMNGVEMEELGRAEIEARVPGLAPRYGFGVLLPGGGHCTDPGGYVAAIAAWCGNRGMARAATRATGFRREGGRIAAVETAEGEIACDAAVLAAGIRSARLAAACGDRVPLEAERGYHVELSGPVPELPVPVMPQDLKAGITRTASGLRIAGQVEFATADAAPDWDRAEILREALVSCFAGLETAAVTETRWQGNRPSTPDGLPVIGPASGCAGVFYAFGHGHIGLCSAPATAALVADLIAGREPEIAAAPFSARRFA
ncbi:FAD-binding oxidoreductase [Mangrovicoccus sp. HB161399]|uniref:NAD(P)/FAD-dependent oxidoreductase n=1 Tax=Mangrovicoccus sp. HB161399 TaxID=2720392 RepID=UPI001554B2EF|nr:FAD-dependent oxidoreductase [Mangrovicoccus sp. HB161399]